MPDLRLESHARYRHDPPFIPCARIEGGRVDIEGTAFPVDRTSCRRCASAAQRARVVFASATRLGVVVPAGLDGGRAPVQVRHRRRAGEPAFVDIAAPFATGLHQVDNPVFDRDGNLYVTYSGTRGQQVPVSIFRVRPNGTRETFSSGIVNPTSMAIDPTGQLYVSSRFEGTVYRVTHGRIDGSRSRTISASPAASRSRPTARCLSAIDPARSSASTATGACDDVRDAAGERRGVPSGDRRRTARLRHRRRRCRPTTALSHRA